MGRAHKFWRACRMTAPSTDLLELSEFHLCVGATRVDAAATLTSNVAPNSGTMANLKDDNTATGAYWSSAAADVQLTWSFPTAQAVDGIVLGARTTIARYPNGFYMLGSDDGVDWTTLLVFGGLRFASAAKSAVLTPGQPRIVRSVVGTFDFVTPGGIGRVEYLVQREVLPRTTPPTYVPQWAKVRLERDIDGRVVRENWSDPVTGRGSFERVDENYLYTITAIYPNNSLRAVIADRVKPEGYPV